MSLFRDDLRLVSRKVCCTKIRFIAVLQICALISVVCGCLQLGISIIREKVTGRDEASTGYSMIAESYVFALLICFRSRVFFTMAMFYFMAQFSHQLHFVWNQAPPLSVENDNKFKESLVHCHTINYSIHCFSDIFYGLVANFFAVIVFR
ncbi:unnamed protein product [Caenorhabditis brenneri]